jgi:hypothetical protein
MNIVDTDILNKKCTSLLLDKFTSTGHSSTGMRRNLLAGGVGEFATRKLSLSKHRKYPANVQISTEIPAC